MTDHDDKDDTTPGGHDDHPDDAHDTYDDKDGTGHGGHDDHADDTHDDADDHDEAHDHDHHHHDVASLGVAVVTVSSSRSLDDDPSGDAIESALEAEGHAVVTRDLIGDSLDSVQGTVDHLVGRDDVDTVVTTGGTGVTPDDVTVEAVRPLFEKRLPGFGELFRRLSYDEIGTKIVGTRAAAGIADGVPVFCLPGSENAATLGTTEIIVHEAGHLAGLARRDDPDD